MFQKNRSIIIFAAVLFVVAAVATFLPERSTPPQTVRTRAASARTAIVYITEDGFSPSTLKVKQNTRVIWSNSDSEAHRVAANPYGTHASLPALDSLTNIDTSSSYSFVFTNAGVYNYHDELHPEINGVIEVEK